MNIRKGKTPFELLFHRMPTLKNLIRFGADVIVKLPQESIFKSRSNIEAVCGTFIGTATDSNCHRVRLKGDSKMRVLLTTNIRPLKSFNFLTHSLKVYCVAQKDPRAKFVDEPGSATGSGSTIFSSNGSGQLRRTLPSLSPANDIVAHDSGDSGAHTMRKRQELGETKYTTMPPIDHAKNLVEDSALLGGPNLGDESIHRGIEDHSPEGNSVDKMEARVETSSPGFLAKPGEELAKSYKPVSDMRREAPEDEHLRRTSDHAEPSITPNDSNIHQDFQHDSTGAEIKLQTNPATIQVKPEVTKTDAYMREHSTTLTRKSRRSNKTSRRRPHHSKKSDKPESNLHHKPLLVAIPDESNDIQMLDDTEMPFLLAPIDEQEYQNMLNSIDYRMIHSTAPSQIHDIALTEESDTFPADNKWMIMDGIPPPEPVLPNAGEQPSTHVGDATLGHQEVLGPTNPNSLVRPAENVVRASSSGEAWGQHWTANATTTER